MATSFETRSAGLGFPASSAWTRSVSFLPAVACLRPAWLLQAATDATAVDSGLAWTSFDEQPAFSRSLLEAPLAHGGGAGASRSRGPSPARAPAVPPNFPEAAGHLHAPASRGTHSRLGTANGAVRGNTDSAVSSSIISGGPSPHAAASVPAGGTVDSRALAGSSPDPRQSGGSRLADSLADIDPLTAQRQQSAEAAEPLSAMSSTDTSLASHGRAGSLRGLPPQRSAFPGAAPSAAQPSVDAAPAGSPPPLSAIAKLASAAPSATSQQTDDWADFMSASTPATPVVAASQGLALQQPPSTQPSASLLDL